MRDRDQLAESDDAAERTIAEWWAAREALDGTRAAPLLAPMPEFRSPLLEGVRFVGREQVGVVFETVFPLFTWVRVHTALREGSDWLVLETADVRGHSVEGVQILRTDEEGRLVSVALALRPLPGVSALLGAIAGPIAHRAGRPVVLVYTALVLGRLLSVTNDIGNRFAVWLISRWLTRTAPPGTTTAGGPGVARRERS